MFVSLIGMPGGGKSTVGRHLARRLGVPFSDSDAVIERRLAALEPSRPLTDWFVAWWHDQGLRP